jgi:hypothetical protein
MWVFWVHASNAARLEQGEEEKQNSEVADEANHRIYLISDIDYPFLEFNRLLT